jgi:uncharacterized membrane protein YbhN (UPF0104 family)
VEAGLDRRHLTRGVVRLVVVAGLIVLALSSLPGLDALRARVTGAQTGWIVACGALEVASVLSFVIAFHCAVAPRLGWRGAASLALTAQGVNVLVPAGGTGGLAAVTVVMTRAGIPRGFALSRMIALFLITAVATNVTLVVVAGIGVATGLLPGHAPLTLSLVPAAAAVLLVAVIAYLARRWPETNAPSTSRWRRLAQVTATHLREGLTWSAQLLRARDPLLILGSLGFVLFDLGALAAAFRAVGSSGLPLGTMVLSYTLGQVGSIVSLPGTTEGGLLGVFVLYGALLTVTASAILIYRAAQSLIPLALGLVGLVGVRRLLGEELSPAEGTPRLEAR